MGKPNLSLVESLDNNPDEEYPLIPNGVYSLGFDGYYTRRLHNTGKLQIDFRVQDMGLYFGKKVSRYFNVSTQGKPRKNGGFKVTKAHDAWLELSRVLVFNRGDRIPIHNLNNCLIRAKVRAVTRNAKQKERNEQSQYSVVDEILEKDP